MDHFCFSKKFWNPYFYSVSCDKIENGCPFSPLRCGFFQRKQRRKKGRPGGQQLFHPNTPIMRKPEKYIDPSRLAIPIRLSVMVPLKRQPKNPPTHKRADKTLSRRNNIRTEQSRKDNPKMTTRIDKKQTRTHNKNTTQAETQNTQAETQKKGRARTKKTTNPKNASTRDKLDRKKVVCQTPNTTKTNMKQQRIPYSLKR